MNHKNISKKIIAQYLPAHPAIVEAGAHIGRDSVKMAKEWPTCTIHAFEPVPEVFSSLKANAAPYSNIFCYPLALSAKTGFEQFYVSSGRSTATSSLLKPQEKKHVSTTFTRIHVPSMTLDCWANKYAIQKIDMLWLDLQGAELNVLKAALKSLKTISVIYTEVNFIPRYENMPLYPEITAWLQQHGFQIVAEAFANEYWGNVLFVR